MWEYSVLSILTGTVVSFIAGTSLTWTSPEISKVNSTAFYGNLSDDQSSWIGGAISMGAALGPFVFGYLADKIGRKFTLIAIAIPFAVCSVIMAFAKNIELFYGSRFVTGLSVGGTFTVLPMYIGEMSLDEHRGVLGTTMNVFICFGLIFTYVAGSYLSVLAFNLLLAAIPTLFVVVFFFVGAETPNYLVMKNKHDEAKAALQRIRSASDDANEKELEHIKGIIEGEEQGNLLDIFRSKGLTKAFIISVGLVFFQQASGINAVLFFASQIFEDADTGIDPMYCSMIIGGVQFGTSFITPLVSNLFGRKLLLVFSGIGMFLSESILGIYRCIYERDPDKVSSLSFLPIVSLVLYILTYNVGYGPLPWAVIGEIFPNSIKSAAAALATCACWSTSFFITKWFKQISDTLGLGECFLGFAVASLIAAGFGQFFVLETKGKSLKQIQEDLNK